jgi:polyphosphate kinase 2 (PPK2 family)
MKYNAVIVIKVCEFEAKDNDQANNRLNFIEKMLSDNGILPVQSGWELAAIQQTEGESNA